VAQKWLQQGTSYCSTTSGTLAIGTARYVDTGQSSLQTAISASYCRGSKTKQFQWEIRETLSPFINMGTTLSLVSAREAMSRPNKDPVNHVFSKRDNVASSTRPTTRNMHKQTRCENLNTCLKTVL